MIEQLLPEEIEKRSFEIIALELEERGILLPEEEEMITKRVIHTSADFDYAQTLTFSFDAVRIAKALLFHGADIVTDTNMALAGINKKVLENCGIDSDEYSGIAFGIGIERITMLKYGINHMGLLFENNEDFLKQFKA